MGKGKSVTRSSWRGQRGEGKAGCVFWLLALVVAGYLGFQIIPAKINDMHIKDHMIDLAADQPRATARDFENSIMKRADELGIPLEKQNVQVEKTLKRARMKIEYTVVIDLIVTDYEMHFDHDIERDIFIL